MHSVMTISVIVLGWCYRDSNCVTIASAILVGRDPTIFVVSIFEALVS